MKLTLLAALLLFTAGCVTFESSKPQNEPLTPPPWVVGTQSL